MRIRWDSLVVTAAVVALFSLNPMPADAQQDATESPEGPAPRLPNGKPDLSGLWAEPYTPNMAGRNRSTVVDPLTGEPLVWARMGEELPDAAIGGRTFDLPYTELGLQRWKQYDPTADGDYAGSCMPFGLSRSVNSPHGVQDHPE